jgi:hypothetical protein
MPHVQLWEAILLILIVDALVAYAIARLHHEAPKGSWFSDSQRAAAAFAVTGTIFAVLVGFVFLLAFQSFQNARSSARDEAIAALGLFNSADRFTVGDQGHLQADAICYGRAVVSLEWPAMADERSSPVVDDWIGALSQAFNGVPLRGAAQSDAAQNWFDETDSLQQGRQGRLAEAPRVIPTTIWILLLIAGLAVIVFSPLFSDSGERLWAQLALGIAVTTAVAASLLTVNFLDRPYGSHAGAIQPTAMRSALATMERGLPPATRNAVRVRCDASGRPVA